MRITSLFISTIDTNIISKIKYKIKVEYSYIIIINLGNKLVGWWQVQIIGVSQQQWLLLGIKKKFSYYYRKEMAETKVTI